MKSLPRIGCQLVRLSLLAVPLGAIFCPAQSPSAKRGSIAILRSVKVISDAEGPALEIVSSRTLNPTVESLDGPPRLVVNLPNTRTHLPRKPLLIGTAQVSALRVNQSPQMPPVTRVVVDLLRPVGYSTDSHGERLLVHLHPMAESRPASPEPPSVPALTRGIEPAVVPVGTGNSQAVVEVGSRLAGDSSVTAGPETTILRLARGGEVRVCPGTTLSVTTSQNGRDLMFGMSTGALEAHYTLNTSADSVLTPDFRMLLAGPGEFHCAFRTDARGNTCVRALPGNTASVIVSELMGNGTYQVKPNEQILFRSGQLSQTDEATSLGDCGCPPPQIPALQASADPVPTISEKDLPRALHLAQPGDEAKPVPESASGFPASATPRAQVALTVTPPDTTELPAPEPDLAHVQIEAPFVFRAADSASAPPNLRTEGVPMSRSTSQAPLLMTAEPPPDAGAKLKHKTVFGKVKGFVAGLFR